MLDERPARQQVLASCTRVTLYAALFAMPIAGYCPGVGVQRLSREVVRRYITFLTLERSTPEDLVSAIHLTIGWIIAAAFTPHVIGVNYMPGDETPARSDCRSRGQTDE